MSSERELARNLPPKIREKLQCLIENNISIKAYQDAMKDIGFYLGEYFCQASRHIDDPILVISTAEDADFLTLGLLEALKEQNIASKIAVFWNHHYQLSNNESVASIKSNYLEDGYQECKHIIILKSIISGGCVIQTNLMAIFEAIGSDNIENISILSPVMHIDAPKKLKNLFSSQTSEKFHFYSCAIDKERDPQGIVIPGIGGNVYKKLGLSDQPALIKEGYMPEIVTEKLFFS